MRHSVYIAASFCNFWDNGQMRGLWKQGALGLNLDSVTW